MKYSIIAAFFFFSLASLKSQGIEFFHGDWKEALDKAKAEDKVLFIDCFTTWCGPCKAMAKNTFTQKEVGDFFNKTFINLKLDMETPNGRDFESKYAVSAYPTLYFLDGAGKVLKKVVGGQRPDGLLAAANEALKGFDNSGDYAAEYEKGNRDYDLMVKYVKSLNSVGKPSIKIANDYLESNPEISNEQKLRFIYTAAVEADSKIFENMLQNKTEIIELVGEEAFNEKVNGACKNTVKKAIEYETETLLDEAILKAKDGMTTGSDAFIYTSQMQYYNAFDNKTEYMKAAAALAKKVGKKDPVYLKYVVEDLCRNYANDQDFGKKAAEYAKSLYSQDKSIDNLQLYCKALISAKEFDKAIKVSQEALEDASKSESKDKPLIEGLINYIKNQKEKS